MVDFQLLYFENDATEGYGLALQVIGLVPVMAVKCEIICFYIIFALLFPCLKYFYTRFDIF